MSPNNQDYFDFTTEQELPEEQTSRMKPCPHCKQPIPANRLFCLYCGEPVSGRRKHGWMVLVAILVLLAFMFWIFAR